MKYELSKSWRWIMRGIVIALIASGWVALWVDHNSIAERNRVMVRIEKMYEAIRADINDEVKRMKLYESGVENLAAAKAAEGCLRGVPWTDEECFAWALRATRSGLRRLPRMP